MSRIKVGDVVTMNNKAKGLGEFLYTMVGLHKGTNHTVSSVDLTDTTYEGEINLEGYDDAPFVMEDFDVVSQ